MPTCWLCLQPVLTMKRRVGLYPRPWDHRVTWRYLSWRRQWRPFLWASLHETQAPSLLRFRLGCHKTYGRGGRTIQCQCLGRKVLMPNDPKVIPRRWRRYRLSALNILLTLKCWPRLCKVSLDFPHFRTGHIQGKNPSTS